VTAVVAAWQTEGAWRRLSDYLALTKPRVVAMVLVTTAVGFHLGSAGSLLFLPLLWTLAGTALAAGGTLALNQYMERDLDARMDRTRHRPLPEGRVHPDEALVLGCALLVAGVALLAFAVEPLAAVVTAAIAIIYLLLYTPLKRVSSLCSLVGAIPGALPPVAGWAAARGTLGVEPWILFAIMFLWQIPHTLAIGRVYRDDYARAGVRVLPVVDRDGRTTGLQAVCNCLALLPVALLPTVVGFAGTAYFMVALVLGLAFLWSAVGLARGGRAADARRLLFASLVYLPVLLAVMALDKLAS
jgi:protoheme IX farnesyltransferase